MEPENIRQQIDLPQACYLVSSHIRTLRSLTKDGVLIKFKEKTFREHFAENAWESLAFLCALCSLRWDEDELEPWFRVLHAPDVFRLIFVDKIFGRFFTQTDGTQIKLNPLPIGIFFPSIATLDTAVHSEGSAAVAKKALIFLVKKICDDLELKPLALWDPMYAPPGVTSPFVPPLMFQKGSMFERRIVVFGEGLFRAIVAIRHLRLTGEAERFGGFRARGRAGKYSSKRMARERGEGEIEDIEDFWKPELFPACVKRLWNEVPVRNGKHHPEYYERSTILTLFAALPFSEEQLDEVVERFNFDGTKDLFGQQVAAFMKADYASMGCTFVNRYNLCPFIKHKATSREELESAKEKCFSEHEETSCITSDRSPAMYYVSRIGASATPVPKKAKAKSKGEPSE